jgi:hypothetical protein
MAVDEAAAERGARGAMSERKTTIGTAVVTESAAQATLRRGPARALAPEEERALRMRFGASPPRTAALERLAAASDADIELLAYEIEAWMRLGRGSAARITSPTENAVAPTASRTKEKIVRALRRKG